MDLPVSALFREGDLAGCLDAAQHDVRREPASPKPRVFLAQLLMVLGQWDRALNQLKALKELDPGSIPMATAYAAAIQCELFRAEIFSGQRSPLIFGEPPPWIGALVEALRLLSQGREEEAAVLRAAAFEDAPAVGGSLNGQPFQWLADADSRLGPILEVLLNGSYYWLPFHRLKSLEIDPPEDVRDLVWIPARLRFVNEGESVALIPSRYPGSESGTSAIQLVRRTEWRDIGGGGYAGLGQRVLSTDQADVGLLEVRSLTFHAEGP